MKATVELPCCGEDLIVEADTPEELAAKLTVAMNEHYRVPAFKCKTMEDWWTIAAASGIPLLVEDGETLEEEYHRVLRGKTLYQRLETLATYGFIIGMETVMTGGKGTLIPVPELSLREQVAFESSMHAGATAAVRAGLEKKYIPDTDVSGITATEEELLAYQNGGGVAAVPPVDPKRAFEELKAPPAGTHFH